MPPMMIKRKTETSSLGKKTNTKEEYLKSLYMDPSSAGSFSGIKKLKKGLVKEGRSDISREDIKNIFTETGHLHC